MRSSVRVPRPARELGERRRDPLGRLVEREVEQHLDLPASTARSRARGDVRDRVEALRRRGAGVVAIDAPRHPVDAERPQVLAAVIVRSEVPAPGVDDEAVRAELALAPLARERAVRGAHATPAPDRVGERAGAPPPRPARRAVAALVNADVRLERLDLRRRSVAGRTRMDLRERALDGSASRVEPEPPRGDQPEHDHHDLVVAQHQRRQPVAGPQAIAAADAALALDRDAELLQAVDVAPHRAGVDAEALARSRGRS